MQAEVNLAKMLGVRPGAVRRLGAGLFVQAPLYLPKKKYKAVYINRALFSRLFSPKRELSFDEMAEVIESGFNFTVEPENGRGEPIGTAWVDRQEDPLGLSLAGNQGSGRAYYTGGIFNIKGEKTPLATATRRQFSDGLLEMERCIWETLIADSLQGSLGNGLGPVLAILDMEETCSVVWRDKLVRRGKIIRIDFDGALDRVTHAFYLKKPLSAATFKKCADSFGVLEGDKFIERIVHGTWSPGNISLKGHLIDFDTVSAVKGRAPQYSSTQWHHENYFGYEYLGQAKILKAMTESPALNKAGVSYAELEKRMTDRRQLQIEQRFAGLMGFKNPDKIYARHKKEIRALVILWQELARKCYRKISSLSCKEPESLQLHVFDFSAFFRVYPMQKRFGLFSAPAAVALLCDTGLKKPFHDKSQKPKDDIEKKYQDAVFAVIGGDFVESAGELDLLKIAALQFVKQYDALFEKIIKGGKEGILDVEARAYAVNEDRRYLFPAHTVSFRFAEQEKLNPWQMQCVVSALVTASLRGSGHLVSDVRVFKEGYSFIVLDGAGFHRKGLCIFKRSAADPPKKITKERELYLLKNETKNNEIICLTGRRPNRVLTESGASEKAAKTGS